MHEKYASDITYDVVDFQHRMHGMVWMWCRWSLLNCMLARFFFQFFLLLSATNKRGMDRIWMELGANIAFRKKEKNQSFHCRFNGSLLHSDISILLQYKFRLPHFNCLRCRCNSESTVSSSFFYPLAIKNLLVHNTRHSVQRKHARWVIFGTRYRIAFVTQTKEKNEQKTRKRCELVADRFIYKMKEWNIDVVGSRMAEQQRKKFVHFLFYFVFFLFFVVFREDMCENYQLMRAIMSVFVLWRMDSLIVMMNENDWRSSVRE